MIIIHSFGKINELGFVLATENKLGDGDDDFNTTWCKFPFHCLLFGWAFCVVLCGDGCGFAPFVQANIAHWIFSQFDCRFHIVWPFFGLAISLLNLAAPFLALIVNHHKFRLLGLLKYISHILSDANLVQSGVSDEIWKYGFIEIKLKMFSGEKIQSYSEVIQSSC